MAQAPRSNPYLAQQSAGGRGRDDLVEDARSGPKAPPADGELGEAPGTGVLDGAQRTRASFVRRSFSRRSTVGAASEGSFSSQGGSEYDPPSAMEIIEYAKYLGMNPIYDADLLWIAAEGLTAPLPAGWTEHEDQDGNLYFYNTATDHSTREHPLDKHYRQTYLNEKRKKDQLTGAREDTVEEKKGGKGFGGLFSKNKDEAAPENPPAELNLPLAEDPLVSISSSVGAVGIVLLSAGVASKVSCAADSTSRFTTGPRGRLLRLHARVDGWMGEGGGLDGKRNHCCVQSRTLSFIAHTHKGLLSTP